MPTDAVLGSDVDEELAGLDHLEVHDATRQPRWLRVWNAVWPKVAAIGLLIGVWQVLVWSKWKKPYQLWAPAKVWERHVQDLGTAKRWQALGWTEERAEVHPVPLPR